MILARPTFRLVALVCGSALLALAAAPTLAQAPFQTGDTAIAAPGAADAACLTSEALERYNSAREMCLSGAGEECQVVKDMQGDGRCGFHYGVYVVTGTTPQEGWIQISPTADRSLSFWADARDFLPSE